jgi:UDP-N-acetylmuramoylalanine--D-glutamate ligase
MNVNGKRVVVLGLGISGMNAAQLLHDHGARVTVRDNASGKGAVEQRAEVLRRGGIDVELGEQVTSDTAFNFGVLSPGINPTSPLVRKLVEASVPMMGELEVAYRFCKCSLVAITGTNGKTTTTELVEALLKAGGLRTTSSGNIGTAFSSAVRGSAELDTMVVEVSSFQLEQIVEFRPHVSVHLNLTPDHLDRYASMAEYEAAKWQIFRNQTTADFAVVNAELCLPEMKARRISFSVTGKSADYELIGGWLCAGGRRVLEQNRTHLIGPHNAENMLAALAVADLHDVPRAASLPALCAYQPLPHRLEKIATVGGVTYLNDSKATNIDALEKALLSMSAPVVLIAGGKDKGLDFAGLQSLVRGKVKAVVLIGQMTEKLFALWSPDVTCVRAGSLADAVDQAAGLAKPGDVVLLSPGCSSYDMFKDFEDRGDQFRALVLARPERN